jgi:adenosylcobyric acid synthase
MEDAAWLARTGWKRIISKFAKGGGRVFGICGGYQLLGERIKDPFGVESKQNQVKGMGLLPITTILEAQKVVHRVTGTCLLNQKRVNGYEIHMGRTRSLGREGAPFVKIHLPGDKTTWTDGWFVNGGQISGTYVHGILDSLGFRGEFINSLRRTKGLKERVSSKGRLARFHQYDRLADHFETHCDVEKILSYLGN